ncbi:hypothetical protein KY310_04425 [Candidatus Woesearchaeota archaeon]|nr:hypothetical protein [Candidatus Woesearchaeota archaeon]
MNEAFNFFKDKPGQVYLPYGSGELFDNYLTWQIKTARNWHAKKDVRLKTKPDTVTQIDVLAARPLLYLTSCADKLTGLEVDGFYIPQNDIIGAKHERKTGEETGVYNVDEQKIVEAYKILTHAGITAEPSAAAGLALFLQRHEEGISDPRKKHLIINTGRGLVA